MDNRIIFADDLPDSTLHDRVNRGELVRLARGVYSTEVDADPSDVVRQSWREIVGRRFPDAVVTDRSVMWAQPHDGYLFIASTREGTLDLPGLVVVSRKGRGAIEGDIAMGPTCTSHRALEPCSTTPDRHGSEAICRRPPCHGPSSPTGSTTSAPSTERSG